MRSNLQNQFGLKLITCKKRQTLGVDPKNALSTIKLGMRRSKDRVFGENMRYCQTLS